MKRILQATILLALLLAVTTQVNIQIEKSFKYEAVANDTGRHTYSLRNDVLSCGFPMR